MKEIEKAFEETMQELIEQFKTVSPGSEESKTIIKNACELSEQYLKYIKSEDDIFNNDAQREKLHAETKKLKLEIEKLENSDPTFKDWLMQIRPEQVMNGAIILMIAGAAMNMEKNGHIFPERLVRIGMKLFGK